MITLLAILALGFALRLTLLSGHTTDDMVHLAFVKLRRAQRSFFNNLPSDSVIPGTLGYPMLAHYIISRFPRRMWKTAGKFLNIGYDLLLIVITWILASIALPTSQDLLLSPPDMAALVVATSPCLLPITARIKSLGARTLGNVMTMTYFLAVWASIAHQPLLFGSLAVLIGLVIISTSQFGIQAVVLTSPFLSLFTWSWLPIAESATLLLVLAGLYKINCSVCHGIRDNVDHMIEHKRWYSRNHQQGTTAMGRNRIRDLLSLPKLWVTNKDVFFGVLFRRNTYIIALYSFPLFWVALYMAASDRFNLRSENLVHMSLAVIFAMTCVFFLTSTKRLSFLGQAERYFEYAVPFAAFILAHQIATQVMSPKLGLFIIVWQLIFSLFNLAYTHFASIKNALISETGNKMVEYLDNHSGMRILTIPMKLSNYFSYMSDGDHAYYFKLVLHHKHGMRHRDKEMPWLELPSEDLSYFHDEYGVDTIIVQKDFLAKMEKENNFHYNFSDFTEAYKDEDYIVYKLHSALQKPLRSGF